MWTGAILAGGRARRLGGLNKARLILHPGSASVLDRQLARLRRVVDRTIIIANDAERFSGTGVPVIPDVVPGHGALGGLYTAVHAGTEWTLVVACDMPFLDERFLEHMAALEADLVIPRSARGYEPLCAIYSRACAAPIRERLIRGELKAARLPEGVKVAEMSAETVAAYDPDGLLLLNVNTPHDYERAKQVLEGRSKTSRDRIMDELGP